MEKKSVIFGFILAIVLFGLIALASAEDWNLGNPVTVQNQNVTGKQNLTFLPENAIVIIGASGNVTSDVANLTYYAANQTLVVSFLKGNGDGLTGVPANTTGAVILTPSGTQTISGQALDISTSGRGTANTDASTEAVLIVENVGGGDNTRVQCRTTGNCQFGVNSTNPNSLFRLMFNNATWSAETLASKQNGNLGIYTNSFPSGGGTPVFIMAQAGSAPTGLGSNTAGIYVLDVSGTAELFTIDEGGTSTQQTSHPSDFLNTLPNDENHTFPWVYTASNPYLGKKVIVDEEAAFRALEALTGKRFVYVENITKTSWADTENWRESEENNRSRNSALEAWLRNASDIPVDKNDAFETITETITETTGNVTGVDMEYTYDIDGNVVANTVPIYEIKTKIKTKKVKKENVFFDKKNGTFYRKPTRAEAELAVGVNYTKYTKQAPPKWMADRGAN